MKDKINWALVGTGGITNKFLVGLRAANGRAAAVVSRTRENAQDFAARNGIEKAFDNFDHMLEDPSVDAVYIGTPHTSHRDLTVRALRAGKAVLCEKPAAINAAELKEMICAARENNVFFMEAMWTRFIPPLRKVREWLSGNLIGDVHMAQANLGFNNPFNPHHRLFNLELGGGALLDLGIYPLSLISMIFGGKKPADIQSRLFFGKSGADEEDAVILSYGGPRIAYAASSFTAQLENDAWIYGTRGRIYIPNFVWSRGVKLLLDGKDEYHFQPEFISNGYNYEAEEVMLCIREGKTESAVMPLDESLVITETMDAIRGQWNFRYPGEKESGDRQKPLCGP